MQMFLSVILVSFPGQNALAQDNKVEEISDFVFSELPRQIIEKLPDGLVEDIKTKSDLGAVIEIGGLTNDNLSIDDIDLSTGNSDVAAKASVLLSYDQGIGDKLNFGVSYKGSQTLYQDFTDFDFQSHLLTAEADYKIKKYKVGVIYRNADSTLAGDDFLKLTQVSPFVSSFVGEKTFIRAAYAYSDKDFDSAENRSAREHQGRVDAYYFLNGTRQYVILGYALEHSNAQGDPFDFLSNRVRLSYVHKFKLGPKRVKLGASWSYELRDFENLTPSINAVREDDRHRGRVNLEVPINKSLYSRIEYKREMNSSNLSSADFNRNTVSFTLGLKL